MNTIRKPSPEHLEVFHKVLDGNTLEEVAQEYGCSVRTISEMCSYVVGLLTARENQEELKKVFTKEKFPLAYSEWGDFRLNMLGVTQWRRHADFLIKLSTETLS